jgi:hypothetical protein
MSDNINESDNKPREEADEEAARSTMGTMAIYAAPVMVALLAGERMVAAASV